MPVKDVLVAGLIWIGLNAIPGTAIAVALLRQRPRRAHVARTRHHPGRVHASAL